MKQLHNTEYNKYNRILQMTFAVHSTPIGPFVVEW